MLVSNQRLAANGNTGYFDERSNIRDTFDN